MIERMREIGRAHGLDTLIAPVRPNLKHRYPLTPIESYMQWAEMAFPETGSYVVPGALVPVEIDRERDEGLYLEPNVWMVHPPSAAE
jgi:hypothetical protein